MRNEPPKGYVIAGFLFGGEDELARREMNRMVAENEAMVAMESRSLMGTPYASTE